MYIVLAPTNGEWNTVWEDNFDSSGAIDTTKWKFEIGNENGGWGKCFLFNVIFVV